MLDELAEIKLVSGLQRQTAQTAVSHGGHPVTRQHAVASRSAGQTGECLRADNVFYPTAGDTEHMCSQVLHLCLFTPHQKKKPFLK